MSHRHRSRCRGAGRRGRLRAAIGLSLAGSTALAIGLAAPAAGIETNTFGLATTNETAAIIVNPGPGAAAEQFRVYNKTARPITVALDVVSASYNPATQIYSKSRSATGFAAGIHVPTTRVALRSEQSRTLTMSVGRPSSTKTRQYAELLARLAPSPKAPVHSGSKTAPPLALLIILEPSSTVGAGSSGDGHRALIGTATGLVVVALAGLAVVIRRRRRPASARA